MIYSRYLYDYKSDSFCLDFIITKKMNHNKKKDDVLHKGTKKTVKTKKMFIKL